MNSINIINKTFLIIAMSFLVFSNVNASCMTIETQEVCTNDTNADEYNIMRAIIAENLRREMEQTQQRLMNEMQQQLEIQRQDAQNRIERENQRIIYNIQQEISNSIQNDQLENEQRRLSEQLQSEIESNIQRHTQHMQSEREQNHLKNELQRIAEKANKKISQEMNNQLQEMKTEIVKKTVAMIGNIEPRIREIIKNNDQLSRKMPLYKIQNMIKYLERETQAMAIKTLQTIIVKGDELLKDELTKLDNITPQVENILGDKPLPLREWKDSDEYYKDNTKSKVEMVLRSELSLKELASLERMGEVTEVERTSPYEFLSPQGDFLERNKNLHSRLYNTTPMHEQGERAKEIGITAVELADKEFSEGNSEEAELAHNIGIEMLDIALGIIPGISIGKDAYEAISGKNILTGEDIGTLGQSLAILGVATLGLSNYAKAPVKIAIKVLKKIKAKTLFKSAFNIASKGALKIMEAARKLGLKAKSEITDFTGIMQKASQSGTSRLHESFGELAEKVVRGLKNKDGLAFVKGIPGLKYTDKGTWISEAGIVYGKGSKHFNRLKHILLHRMPDPTKKVHSVFRDNVKQIPKVIDEAWKKKGLPTIQGNGRKIYEIPMGRSIGIEGESKLFIIIKKGTSSEIVSAYPVK